MMATSSNETAEEVLSSTDCETLVPLCTELDAAITQFTYCKDAFLMQFAEKINGRTDLVKKAVFQLREYIMNLPQHDEMKTFMSNHQLLSAEQKAQKDNEHNKQWEKFRKQKARLIPMKLNEIEKYVEDYNAPASLPSHARATAGTTATAVTPLTLNTAAATPLAGTTATAATLLAVNTAATTPLAVNTATPLTTPAPATAGSNANVSNAGTPAGTTSSAKGNRSKIVEEAYVYIVVWAPWRDDFKFGRSQSQPKELLRLHGRCNGPAVLFWRVQLTSGSATGSDSTAVESSVLNNARNHELRTDNNEDTTASKEIIKCGEGYENVLKMFDFAMSKLLSLDTKLLCSDLLFYIILQVI